MQITARIPNTIQPQGVGFFIGYTPKPTYRTPNELKFEALRYNVLFVDHGATIFSVKFSLNYKTLSFMINIPFYRTKKKL